MSWYLWMFCAHEFCVHCTHIMILSSLYKQHGAYNNIFDFASLYTVLRLLHYIITDRTSKVIIARVISYVTNIWAVNNRELNVWYSQWQWEKNKFYYTDPLHIIIHCGSTRCRWRWRWLRRWRGRWSCTSLLSLKIWMICRP